MTHIVAHITEEYRQRRAALAFLDCNLWIGRPRQPEFAEGFGIEMLRQRMARYDIHGGVISHFAGVHYSPVWGNEEVLCVVNDTDLWAAITLVPEMFASEEAGRAYLAQTISRGARLELLSS